METQGIMSKQDYRKALWSLAIPITLQCLLQSSFSVVDQIMIGQLGSTSIAAVGICSKFISLLTVLVQAMSTVAGIIIAQAVGRKDKDGISRGFYTNFTIAMLMAAVFTLLSFIIPHKIMGLYSSDGEMISEAAQYLQIYAISFIPLALTSVMSAFLRCMKETKIPLYAGFCSAVLNTALNYLLIYGKLGLPKMDVNGAAAASVISQIAGCAVIVFVFIKRFVMKREISFKIYHSKASVISYLKILLPLFVCEFLWVLGENVYGFIYGHMGTKACAAMTLINPVVSLMIGALSGVAQAAAIMIGELLGAGNEESAFQTGKRLIKTALIGSLTLSALLIALAPFYTLMFNVEADVRDMTHGILIAFAIVSPVKIQNMVLGGGVVRSGGKTKYILMIDIIGTWMFGVPLGFLSAFVFNLPIAWVYFILSLEEVVRLIITAVLFHTRKWVQRLDN